jgi:hypothetical protein
MFFMGLDYRAPADPATWARPKPFATRPNKAPNLFSRSDWARTLPVIRGWRSIRFAPVRNGLCRHAALCGS